MKVVFMKKSKSDYAIEASDPNTRENPEIAIDLKTHLNSQWGLYIQDGDIYKGIMQRIFNNSSKVNKRDRESRDYLWDYFISIQNGYKFLILRMLTKQKDIEDIEKKFNTISDELVAWTRREKKTNKFYVPKYTVFRLNSYERQLYSSIQKVGLGFPIKATIGAKQKTKEILDL